MKGKSKCLVIGANGFVGSHLVDELSDAGYEVRAFDRYSRQPQFKSHQQVEVFKGDLFDDITMSRALKGADYLFHSFSATTPYTSDTDPYTDISLNVLRNVQLFEKAVEAGVKRVIFISSGGAIYGHLAEEKLATEDDAPTPVSPYGIGKLASENYLAYFNRKYDLDYVAYRLTNPYGPRQTANNNQGVVPIFLERMRNSEALQVLGDGTSSRDYIYIRDATAMMVNSFASPGRFRLYNVGSGHQLTVNDIIDTLGQVMGRKLEVNYNEAPKTFLTKSQVSIERFWSEFGKPELTSFSDGVKKTLKQTG